MPQSEIQRITLGAMRNYVNGVGLSIQPVIDGRGPFDPVSLDDLKIIVLMVYWRFGQEPDALILDELCDDSDARLAH